MCSQVLTGRKVQGSALASPAGLVGARTLSPRPLPPAPPTIRTPGHGWGPGCTLLQDQGASAPQKTTHPGRGSPLCTVMKATEKPRPGGQPPKGVHTPDSGREAETVLTQLVARPLEAQGVTKSSSESLFSVRGTN